MAAIARLLRAAGARSLIGREPIGWTLTRPSRQHLAGTLLFGIDWAFSATCPGPVAAQLGRGQLAALLTVAGIFAGVAVFGYFKRRRDSASAPPAKAELFGAAHGL